MKIYRLLLLMLLGIPSFAQTHTFPATDTNNLFTGANTVCSLNGNLSASSTCFATPQAAINALSASGGIVTVPPGTYAAPTSIPNSNITFQCSVWRGCTFTSTTAITFGTANAELTGIQFLNAPVFDFGGNNAGLTIENMTHSKFELEVRNTGTAAGLTLTAPSNTGGLDFYRNELPWLWIENTGDGLVLNGDANVASCGGAQQSGGAVFDNLFGTLHAYNNSGTGLKFTSGADTNDFLHSFLDISLSSPNSSAMVLNSRCGAQIADVVLEHFGELVIEWLGVNGNYTGSLITANNSGAVIDHAVFSNVPASPVTRTLLCNSCNISGMNWDDDDTYGLGVPFFATNRSILNMNFTVATAGANNFASCHEWLSQLWNGSASANSLWSLCPQAQASGQPTFETLVLQNTGSANSNGAGGVGLQIPNRLIITGSTSGTSTLSAPATGGAGVTLPSVAGTLPVTIGSGTAVMTTAGILTGACGTTVTVASTNVLTTDTIDVSRNAAATIGDGGGLTLNWWPTAGNVNFNYCNSSAGTITPTAMTVNWAVRR